MDDKHIDDLITCAIRSRNASAMPPPDFFAAIAARETARRRRRLLVRFSAAASVCIVAAAALWFFQPADNNPVQPSSAGSYLYSESVEHATERIDRLASVQADLRESIDQQFPF